MKLSDLYLNRFLYKDINQNLETKDSSYNAGNVIEETPPPLAAGSAAQDINTSNVFINGQIIQPGTYILTVGDWGWGQTCVFSSTDSDTVAWTSGTFKTASGTIYNINAGNIGNITAKTYIYLDLLVSETEYQTTTVPGNSVGIGKVVVAVANKATAPNLATYNLTEANQIVGDNILANTINASKMDVGQLSFITGNAGTLTAGTLTGLTIQTTDDVNAARIVMDNGNDLTFYDASVGGGGSVTGNSSEITFRRIYDTSKGFVIRQRAGKNDNAENVLEIYGLSPDPDYSNYIFIGRQGNTTLCETGLVSIGVNSDTSRDHDVRSNGTFQVGIAVDGVSPAFSSIYATAARNIYEDNSKVGVAAAIMGSGADGFAGLSWMNPISGMQDVYWYVNSTGLKMGGTFLPDADNAYDIGSSSYTIETLYIGTRISLRETDGIGTNTITLKAPATIASSFYFTLPINEGTDGQFLMTDGAGLTSWEDVGAAGADIYLSNLGSTSINTSLISDSDGVDSLGSGTYGWKNLYLSNGGNIYYNNVYAFDFVAGTAIYVGNFTEFSPYTDGGVSLGSVSYRWGEGHILNLYSSNAYISYAEISSSLYFSSAYLDEPSSIYFLARTSNPTVDGQMLYYDNGDVQFRCQLASIDFSFDLSFV